MDRLFYLLSVHHRIPGHLWGRLVCADTCGHSPGPSCRRRSFLLCADGKGTWHEPLCPPVHDGACALSDGSADAGGKPSRGGLLLVQRGGKLYAHLFGGPSVSGLLCAFGLRRQEEKSEPVPASCLHHGISGRRRKLPERALLCGGVCAFRRLSGEHENPSG